MDIHPVGQAGSGPEMRTFVVTKLDVRNLLPGGDGGRSLLPLLLHPLGLLPVVWCERVPPVRDCH